MTDVFTCRCGKTFDTKKKLAAHQGTCKVNREYNHAVITKVCPICGKEFSGERRSINLTCSPECGRKLNTLNQGLQIRETVECNCLICGKPFSTDRPDIAKLCSRSCFGQYNSWKSFIKKYNLPQDTTYIDFINMNELIPKLCKHCGKPFMIKRIDYETKEYCCHSCKLAQKREDELVEKECPFCGDKYKVSPKNKQKTCGKKVCADKQMQETRKERGYINGFANPDIQKKIIATNIKRHGVPYYCMTDACKDANQRVISKQNIALHEKLLSANIENELEYTLDKFSFDIRSGKYLIEVNPSYTHSCTTASIFDKPKAKTYHQTKTIIANSHGFECIHFFEWEDENKLIEILNPNKDRIYARNCTVRDVIKADADKFLTENHLQGTLRIQPIRFGLYYKDKLVQLITFGKPRYNKNYEYELLRLCTQGGIYVIGGAEKLFKHFVDTHSPKSIISYCDNSKFNGNVYMRLGFNFLRVTQPAIHWYNMQTKQHITEQLLRQQGADRLIGTKFGKGSDNEQILLNNGFVGVADCGQKVYEWKQSS